MVFKYPYFDVQQKIENSQLGIIIIITLLIHIAPKIQFKITFQDSLIHNTVLSTSTHKVSSSLTQPFGQNIQFLKLYLVHKPRGSSLSSNTTEEISLSCCAGLNLSKFSVESIFSNAIAKRGQTRCEHHMRTCELLYPKLNPKVKRQVTHFKHNIL